MGVLLSDDFDEDYAGYTPPSDDWRASYDRWKTTEDPDDGVTYHETWADLEARGRQVKEWLAELKRKQEEEELVSR
jgi:hypothetical protein